MSITQLKRTADISPLYPGSLTQMELPVVVVACKCDLPPSPEVAMFEQTRQLLGAVKVHRTAINDDTSHKKCVSSILSQISNRSGKPTWSYCCRCPMWSLETLVCFLSCAHLRAHRAARLECSSFCSFRST